jgi:hypothetical protein
VSFSDAVTLEPLRPHRKRAVLYRPVVPALDLEVMEAVPDEIGRIRHYRAVVSVSAWLTSEHLAVG